jgi:hypothetical protein
VTDLRLGRWQDVLADDPADGSVRLILTSPPYDNARTYEGTNEPVDFGELAAWALLKLCPGGTLAMVLDGPCEGGRQSITPYRVICEWSALEGWYFHQFLVYGRGGVPGNTKGWFRRDHEPLLVFIREGGEQVCNKERVAERGAKLAGRARSKRNAAGELVRSSSVGALSSDIEHRGSIWWYGANGHGVDPSADTGHPATFAERFARDAVDVWSNPGDLVVDPFAGSATVGRACEDLGRRFVGAERVGPCPRCGGGFPQRCACRSKGCPAGWLNYHAIGQARLAQRGLFSGAA